MVDFYTVKDTEQNQIHAKGDALKRDANGNYWIPFRSRPTEDDEYSLWVSKSTDGGYTWVNTQLTQEVDYPYGIGSISHIAVDNNGNVSIAFTYGAKIGLFYRDGLKTITYNGTAWQTPITLLEPKHSSVDEYSYNIDYGIGGIAYDASGRLHVIGNVFDTRIDESHHCAHWVDTTRYMLDDETFPISATGLQMANSRLAMIGTQLYLKSWYDNQRLFRWTSGANFTYLADVPACVTNSSYISLFQLGDKAVLCSRPTVSPFYPCMTLYDAEGFSDCIDWDSAAGDSYQFVAITEDKYGVQTCAWQIDATNKIYYRQRQWGTWLAAAAKISDTTTYTLVGQEVGTTDDEPGAGAILALTNSADNGIYVAHIGTYTELGLPEVQTDAATGVDADDATLNGTVVDDNCGTHGVFTLFQYGKSTNEDDLSRTDTCGAPTLYNETETFLKAVASLENPGVLYVFRAAGLSCASWDWSTYEGIGLGRWRTFITDPDHPDLDGDSLPTVTTDDATNVVGRAATINGTLTDDGGANKCVCFFIWGRKATKADIEGWENITPSEQCVETDSFDYNLTDLLPNTQYHYRAVAWNDEGYAFGEDKTFWTESPMENGADGAIGMVGSLRHEWEPGSYRLTIGLGGLGKAITTIPNLDGNSEGDPQIDEDIPTEPQYPSIDFPGDISDAEREEHYQNVYNPMCLNPTGMPGEVRVIGGQTAMCIRGRWRTGADLISQGTGDLLSGRLELRQQTRQLEEKMTRAMAKQSRKTSDWAKGKYSPYGTAYSPSFYWHHRFKGVFMPTGGGGVAGGMAGGSGSSYTSLIPELNRWRHEMDILTWLEL